MSDNPMLAATKAAQASRASEKEKTVKGTVPLTVKATKVEKKATKRKPKAAEKMTTIKISQGLARDLADLAQQVRNNNDEPVAPSERVYPAHLVQATLEHLLELPIDWDSIKSINDFQQALKAQTD